MIVHEIFAQIVDGKVVNITRGDNYPTVDHITKCIFGDKAFAVDCLQYKIMVGDLYHDNTFWRINENGEEEQIPYTPTDTQEIQSLKLENDELTLALADAIGAA